MKLCGAATDLGGQPVWCTEKEGHELPHRARGQHLEWGGEAGPSESGGNIPSPDQAEDIPATRHSHIEAVAAAAYAACREWSWRIGLPTTSTKTWAEAPPDLRDRVLDGVRAILDGEITSPSGGHANWVDWMEAHGWVHGALADPVKKEHPNLVPWLQMDTDVRAKNRMFYAVVMAAIDGLDAEVTESDQDEDPASELPVEEQGGPEPTAGWVVVRREPAMPPQYFQIAPEGPGFVAWTADPAAALTLATRQSARTVATAVENDTMFGALVEMLPSDYPSDPLVGSLLRALDVGYDPEGWNLPFFEGVTGETRLPIDEWLTARRVAAVALESLTVHGDDTRILAGRYVAAVDALQGLAALPDGYCVCFHQPEPRSGTKEDHTGECTAIRAVLHQAGRDLLAVTGSAKGPMRRFAEGLKPGSAFGAVREIADPYHPPTEE